MKIFLVTIILTALLFLNNKTFAQNYEVGTNIVNLGAGVGSFWIPNSLIVASYEHGVSQLGSGIFGLGGIVGYGSWNYENSASSSLSGTSIVTSAKVKEKLTYAALNCTWHPDFLNTDKYDVYGAARIGYYYVGLSTTSTMSGTVSGSGNADIKFAGGFTVGCAIGGRYYFTKKLGAFAELGRDVSYSKVGVFLKF